MDDDEVMLRRFEVVDPAELGLLTTWLAPFVAALAVDEEE